ncbi:hypothetical protein QFC22_001877 [Naganishia vaughanmartiniae]|uniref:Uncharacterized protein n=1 Tax=Naganishia vaughanmartiniae TaxID=1424756 RepID=A0ACC2XEW0_9TREE|nr:hypothetical protein QFC22_001877 [Naganishia vaughanmartiniae]
MPTYSFLPFLQNIPVGTRILTGTLVLFSLLHQVLSHLDANSAALVSAYDGSPETKSGDAYGIVTASPYLVLVPGKSFWFPWTFLTAGWVETNIIQFVISVVALPAAAKYLERVWGPRELIRFCIIVIVASNIIAFGLCWIEYIVIGHPEIFLYGPPIQGQTALQTGFLVAFTQLIPEHQVQIFGKLRIRVKNLPGIYLLVSNVLTIVLGQNPYIIIQFGFFVSWVYLRFFKLSENGEFRGDRSETFAFVNWFPPLVRGPLGKVANLVFALAVRFKVVESWDSTVSASSGAAYQMLPGPGGARAEAERRRALALRALDARLASAPTTSAAAQAAAVPLPEDGEASAVDPVVAESIGAAEIKSEPKAFKEGGPAAKE